jgi:pyridoxal phosphate-dependent aminotransferase EpsN
MSQAKRIYLSPPHMGSEEVTLLHEAFASNWIAPLGPHVDAFEREFAAKIGMPHAAALASGTAALHLGLRLLGVGTGDEVFCSTLTFCASANPIAYEKARPVFLDAEEASWNMDPNILRDELRAADRRGKLPKAVVVVDLYGQCADYEPIQAECDRYGVPILEDAAEALGACYRNRPAGTFGTLAAFSFNGNKIITTSGGGMLVGADKALIERARFLSSQARDPAPHYQHSQIGFNYRMSNLLAAIGRGQLRVLDERVNARRRVYQRYQERLRDLPGIAFMPEARGCRSTRWLTCLTIDSHEFGASAEDVRRALDADNIESRPVWKPLHLQPAFAECRYAGGRVAERLFASGLCLPSGSNLTDDDLERVLRVVARVHRAATSRTKHSLTESCNAARA